jgi:kynurenine formamidase
MAQAGAVTGQTVVDLIHTLSGSTPIQPGANPIQVQTFVTHDKDGYYANQWTVHEYHGTHVDAPLHFGKGTWAADWSEFIRMHMDVLVATDFFTAEVWTPCSLVTY